MKLNLGDPQFTTVLFDIDGTLADCEHRRYLVAPPLCSDCGKPQGGAIHYRCNDPGWVPQWDAFFDRCDADPMIVPVVLMARVLKMAGYTIFLVTGRPDRVREKTIKWMRERDVPFDALLMRRDDDHRPDDVVKREVLHKLGPLKAEILCVFDDRESVVKMWREEGLVCCQVAEGKF